MGARRRLNEVATHHADGMVEGVPGLEREFLERVVARLRGLEPSAVAVLVTGNYARRTADEHSDLDVRVVIPRETSSPHRMWFEERPGAELRYVSPVVRSFRGWFAECNETWDWALGFPVFNEVRCAWATDKARTLLGDPPSYVQPHRPPQLEVFVESLAKVRRASALDDGVSVRLFARNPALLAPGLLQPLNEEVVVRDRREALEAALSLRVAPEHLSRRPVRLPGAGSRGGRSGPGRGPPARGRAARVPARAQARRRRPGRHRALPR